MTRLALVLLAGIYVAGCASAPRSVVILAETPWTASDPAERYGWSARPMCYRPKTCAGRVKLLRVTVAF